MGFVFGERAGVEADAEGERARECALGFGEVLIEGEELTQGRDGHPGDAGEVGHFGAVAHEEVGGHASAQEGQGGGACGVKEGALAFDDDEVLVGGGHDFAFDAAGGEIEADGIEGNAASGEGDADLAGCDEGGAVVLIEKGFVELKSSGHFSDGHVGPDGEDAGVGEGAGGSGAGGEARRFDSDIPDELVGGEVGVAGREEVVESVEEAESAVDGFIEGGSPFGGNEAAGRRDAEDEDFAAESDGFGDGGDDGDGAIDTGDGGEIFAGVAGINDTGDGILGVAEDAEAHFAGGIFECAFHVEGQPVGGFEGAGHGSQTPRPG